MAQWKVYVPGLEKTMRGKSYGPSLPVSNAPLSAVAVCSISVRFMKVMADPAGRVVVAGKKEYVHVPAEQFCTMWIIASSADEAPAGPNAPPAAAIAAASRKERRRLPG